MNPKYYYIDGIGNGYLAILNSIRIENMAVLRVTRQVSVLDMMKDAQKQTVK